MNKLKPKITLVLSAIHDTQTKKTTFFDNIQQEPPIKVRFVSMENLLEDNFVRQVAENLPALLNELGENT